VKESRRRSAFFLKTNQSEPRSPRFSPTVPRWSRGWSRARRARGAGCRRADSGRRPAGDRSAGPAGLHGAGNPPGRDMPGKAAGERRNGEEPLRQPLARGRAARGGGARARAAGIGRGLATMASRKACERARSVHKIKQPSGKSTGRDTVPQGLRRARPATQAQTLLDLSACCLCLPSSTRKGAQPEARPRDHCPRRA
jgi:hypothetical protein